MVLSNVAQLTRLVPVEPQLLRPEEVRGAVHLGGLQLVEDVTGVDLDGHQGHQLATVLTGDLAPHHLNVLDDQRLPLLVQALHRLLLPGDVALPQLDQHALHLPRPIDLGGRDLHLPLRLVHPFVQSVLLRRLEGREGLHEGLLQGVPHHGFHAEQPRLHRDPLHQHSLVERHIFFLLADHLGGVHATLLVLLQLQEVNGLEALLQVWLHLRGLPSVAQDLQQIVIRQEVEPGEGPPPVLEVIVQLLLNALELFEHVIEVIQQSLLFGSPEHVGVIVQPRHDLVPIHVDLVEQVGLVRQLFLDII
mmetsp:Transcript_145723/g.254350  ORF Transcript_145723/g.254350 Transcript_145723/m.254350 type:complete len:305 (+) Transcript_145723:1290-2204(+)